MSVFSDCGEEPTPLPPKIDHEFAGNIIESPLFFDKTVNIMKNSKLPYISKMPMKAKYLLDSISHIRGGSVTAIVTNEDLI